MASAKDVANEIDEMIDEATAPMSQAELLSIGHQTINIMVLRARQGLDIDHRPFAKYSTAYAEERAKAGYSTTPDLIRSGHMMQALIPTVGDGGVTVHYMSTAEERKADAHNQGVDSRVPVRVHRRRVAVDVHTGRRVGAAEARKDKRRKDKRVGYRIEAVETHTRNQRLPKREHFGIRHVVDEDIIQDEIVDILNRRDK